MSSSNFTWFDIIAKKVNDEIEAFYNHFYEGQVLRVGESYRINPCPFCGHNDCFTISPSVNAANCFSCGHSGTHINTFINFIGNKKEALRLLSEHFHEPLFEEKPKTPEQKSKEEHVKKLFQIRYEACKYYHECLLNNKESLDYQVSERGHSLETLKDCMIGFSLDYLELWSKLSNMGYSKDEIKEAKVYIPEGLFVYPYIQQRTTNILRFNTKNPFRVEDKEGKVVAGFSSGKKVLMLSKKANLKSLVLVEGENDLLTLVENGAESVGCFGGTLSEENLKHLKPYEAIYCMFDNDEAGAKYLQKINSYYPEKLIYDVQYKSDFSDPDDYYRKSSKPQPIKEKIDNAKLVAPNSWKTYHGRNLWVIYNRAIRLEFLLTSKHKASGAFVGDCTLYKDGKVFDKSLGQRLDKYNKAKPYNLHLLSCMDDFFVSGLDDKDLDGLILTYKYTKSSSHQGDVVKELSKRIKDSNDKRKGFICERIKLSLGEEVLDQILMTVNNLNLKELEDFSDIEFIETLAQHHSPYYKEFIYYYSRMVEEGDGIKILPYFLTSNKKQIRLDLYKREDPQSLLLVDNKYNLPNEVPQALTDVDSISLWQKWVDKWINDSIPKEELSINHSLKTLISHLKDFIWLEDECSYRLLALYILGTYCYKIFTSFPYLHINGPSGSGKSTLDYVLERFSFNAVKTCSITEAALYRHVTNLGGTIILDEVENLTTKKAVVDSVMGALLKAGYSKTAGKVIRCKTDDDNDTENYVIQAPKVISNIYGLENVTLSRCIIINMKRNVPEEELNKLSSVITYKEENNKLIKEITSKFCLTILENFQEIRKTYVEGERIIAGSPRLSEILRPFYTLARIADKENGNDEFVKHIEEFYTKHITPATKVIDERTYEGVIKAILEEIAYNIENNTMDAYEASDASRYNKPIKYDEDSGNYFVIDSLHLYCLLQEHYQDVKFNKNFIDKVLCEAIDIKSEQRKTTRIVIDQESETLREELKHVKTVRAYEYTINLSDLKGR